MPKIKITNQAQYKFAVESIQFELTGKSPEFYGIITIERNNGQPWTRSTPIVYNEFEKHFGFIIIN